MALLLDNDVVHKLSQLNLLGEAKAILQNLFGDVFILNTFKYKFCPSPDKVAQRRKAENRYGTEVIRRFETFLESQVYEVDTEVTDPAFVNVMGDGLDAGEMQLLQVLCEEDGYLMLTGDKRFLTALANTDSLTEKLADVEGQFVCFEQIICMLISQLGFDVVKDQFCDVVDAGLKYDKTLRFCFEGHRSAHYERVNENLNIHIQYVRDASGSLLSSSPVWQ